MKREENENWKSRATRVVRNVRTAWWNLGGHCAVLRAKKEGIGFILLRSVRFAWFRGQRMPVRSTLSGGWMQALNVMQKVQKKTKPIKEKEPA
jgi:hypothetical protein